MLLSIIAIILKMAFIYWITSKISQIDKKNYFKHNQYQLTLPKYNLILGMIVVGFFGFCVLMIIITPTDVNKTATWQMAVFFAVFVLLGFCLIWQYVACRHYFDEMGLTYRTVFFKERFLAWQDIDEIAYSHLLKCGILMDKTGKKFYLWDNMMGLNDFMTMLDDKAPIMMNEILTSLYQLDGYHGVDKTFIDKTEHRLAITLPKVYQEYQLSLGDCAVLNHSFNDILPLDKIDFADDYLIIAKENQEVCVWGILRDDLNQDNPPVYVCNDLNADNPKWFLESRRLSDFLLMMGLFNATMGGLIYHANAMNGISDDVVSIIETHYQELPNLQENGTRYFIKTAQSDKVQAVFVLCFENHQCTALFMASNDDIVFDELLDLDIEWLYISDEDE